MLELFPTLDYAQSDLLFPQPLTERYRPQTIADFAGLPKVRAALSAAVKLQRIHPGYVFFGAPGTGKTSMGQALARELSAQVHHVPSQDCNLQTLQRVAYSCNFVPMASYRRHVVLVDEADRMSTAAQDWLLSKLDGTAPCPLTTWVFTCNTLDRFEDRFLSRCFKLEFSTYGLSSDASALCKDVWLKEAPAHCPAPNFARIVKEANNNIREALSSLEHELLIAAAGVAA